MITKKFPAIVLALLAAGASPGAESVPWHLAPYELEVGGMPLDIADPRLGGYFDDTDPSDKFGHAAPFMADMDADGVRDMVVGSFSGRFRYYRNVGTDVAPRFPKEFSWLIGGNEIAQVTIYCCVASGPQLTDIDGDGVPDLTAGSYDPGYVYWFRGLGKGKFSERQTLKDSSGIPLCVRPTVRNGKTACSFMSNVAWVDWNEDGISDVLMGDLDGRLYVRLGFGAVSTAGDESMAAQPSFWDESSQLSSEKVSEIRIDGKNAVEEQHAAPAVADWDGDGLWDILIGTNTGAVYWLRNTGKPGAPRFMTREQLIGPGKGVDQWVESGATPVRGIRAQINVVDFNNDGKLDILAGDWSYSMSPRADLTQEERRQLEDVRARLAALDEQVGYTFLDWRHKWKPYYRQNPELLTQAQALQKEMAPFLQKTDAQDNWTSVMAAHGYVWIFMRR